MEPPASGVAAHMMSRDWWGRAGPPERRAEVTGSTSCPWPLCSGTWADAKIPLVPSLAGRWICSAGQLWAMQAPGGKLQVSLLCGVGVCWVGWAQLWLCSPTSRQAGLRELSMYSPAKPLTSSLGQHISLLECISYPCSEQALPVRLLKTGNPGKYCTREDFSHDRNNPSAEEAALFR